VEVRGLVIVSDNFSPSSKYIIFILTASQRCENKNDYHLFLMTFDKKSFRNFEELDYMKVCDLCLSQIISYCSAISLLLSSDLVYSFGSNIDL
jgi:hypothetical protein